jgi:hypothetical protein
LESFFCWLQTAELTWIIALIGKRYREKFNQHCRGVDWRLKLRHLQAIAVSLAGKGLATAFRLLSMDYKYYSSGMPDLLVIRAVKSPYVYMGTTKNDDKKEEEEEEVQGSDDDSRDVSEAVTPTRTGHGHEEVSIQDLSLWIGQDWEELYSSSSAYVDSAPRSAVRHHHRGLGQDLDNLLGDAMPKGKDLDDIDIMPIPTTTTTSAAAAANDDEGLGDQVISAGIQ